MSAEWGKIPLKDTLIEGRARKVLDTAKIPLSDMDINPLVSAILFQRANALLEKVGLTPTRQAQLATYRIITPDIAEPIMGIKFGLDAPDQSSPNKEDKKIVSARIAYTRMMNMFDRRGMIKGWYGSKVGIQPDGSIVPLWKVRKHDLNLSVTAGELRPEWRERLLEDLYPEQLQTLHGEAMNNLFATMCAIYKRINSEPEFDISAAMQQITPLMQEYVYQNFSYLILSKNNKVREPYNLSPVVETEETAKLLIEKLYDKAQEIFAGNPYYVADLAFHIGVAVKHEIGKFGDPALALLSENLLKRYRDDLSTPRPLLSFIPATKWFEKWPELSRIFVNHCYDVVTHEVPSKKELLALLAQLNIDKVRVRSGVVLPNKCGGPIEFKTKMSVPVQLRLRDFEKSSIAAIEEETKGRGSKVHLYRTEDRVWTKLGTLIMEDERWGYSTSISYVPEADYKGEIYNNQMVHWSGVAQEPVSSIHVFTTYDGDGNIVFDTGSHNPLTVNPYDSNRPSARRLLPTYRPVPRVPDSN